MPSTSRAFCTATMSKSTLLPPLTRHGRDAREVNRHRQLGVLLSVRDHRRTGALSRRRAGAPATDDAEDTTADERLLAELYRRHERVLFAFVLRLVDDRAKAEDVVQETMLRAWRNLDAIDPRRGDPRSYLFTVAKNVVIDAWRADQRRPRLVTDEETLAAQPVEDRLDARVDAWMVHHALERLSAEHRAVVDHLYYAGSTVTETAQSLGIPPGTVKSRAYYAVRVLRTAFEEMGMTR